MYDEKLVLDNINLIYVVLKRLKLYHKCDEYFDVGMIGLVKGAKTFNKKLGYSPSTYLYRCIYNEIGTELRKKKLDTISLNNPIDELHTFEDIISDGKTAENKYFLETDNIIIDEALKKLSKKEQIIIKTTFGFYKRQLSQKELAEMFGISQPQISRIRTKALKKLKIILERNM